jgi:hypothetical protein
LPGEEYAETARALRAGELERAPISPAERLLEYVGTLTLHAYTITDEQVQGLRDAGWSEVQVAEAAHDGATFPIGVHLADASASRHGQRQSLTASWRL